MSTTDTLSNTKSATKEGIRVEKGIEPGDNAMTVHYRITSERSDAAAVRLEERLGAGFPIETLGLDTPGHGDWLLEADGSELALVDILDAGERVTTGYVVDCSDPGRVESVFDAPRIDMVDPVDTSPAENAGRAEDAERVRSNRAGTAEESDGDDGLVDQTRPADQNRPADQTRPSVTPESVADALSPAVVAEAVSPTLVVDALVRALDADAVDERYVEALRDHVAPPVTRSDGVRFRHLESRLEDFTAYADGLQELIDEHGTATEFLDEVREEVAIAREEAVAAAERLDDGAGDHEAVADRLDAIEDGLASATAELDAADERFDALGGRLDDVNDQFDAVDERFDEMDDRFGGVDQRSEEIDERVADLRDRLDDGLDRLDDRLEHVDDRLERVDDRLDRVDAAVERVDGRTDAMADRTDGIDERLDAVTATVANERERLDGVEDSLETSATELADHVAELEADLAATQQWRRQLGAAFQDDAGGPAGAVGSSAIDEQEDRGAGTGSTEE